VTQQSHFKKFILALVGAIGGSMLALPTLAEVPNQRTPDVYQDHTSPADPNSPLYQQSSDSNSSTQNNSDSSDRSTPDSSNSSTPKSPDVYRDHTSPADPNSPAYQRSQDNNNAVPYNGNGLTAPNDDSKSPDRNNPGINQSPSNRLTPHNLNQNSDDSGR
jgi:hypothetical protein